MLPRVEPVTAPGGGGAGAGASSRASARPRAWRDGGSTPPRAELEIDGLRAYREGSPASRIHWPTVARRGEMMERRMVAELDSAPLVVLDCSSPGGEEELDMAVRAAGSLCVHLARSRLRDPAAGRAPAGGDRSRPGRLALRARAPRAGRAGTTAVGRRARPAQRGRALGHRGRRCGRRRARSSGCPPGRASWWPGRAPGGRGGLRGGGLQRLPARPGRPAEVAA